MGKGGERGRKEREQGKGEEVNKGRERQRRMEEREGYRGGICLNRGGNL